MGARKPRGTDGSRPLPSKCNFRYSIDIRKQTTANPEPMPINTASNKKNCSSRRLKRCGDSMVRRLLQYCRRVGVETAGLIPLASFGLATTGSDVLT